MDVKEHTSFGVGEGMKLGKWSQKHSSRTCSTVFHKVI